MNGKRKANMKSMKEKWTGCVCLTEIFKKPISLIEILRHRIAMRELLGS